MPAQGTFRWPRRSPVQGPAWAARKGHELRAAIKTSIACGLAILAVALPVFFAGTVIRTREEERLLRRQFGSEYDDYARTTPAFIPRIG